ncbi:hypothetical protein EYF80_033650 [Liparis tanakae]|uniref:Uncharacterized protein n=1 Tax=Liparis tanakae TaxID=230148 RepID=A0A4Z2GS76_9TELE|nr:hypothetical protein EYF80_033650 [Liparis tanakae]
MIIIVSTSSSSSSSSSSSLCLDSCSRFWNCHSSISFLRRSLSSAVRSGFDWKTTVRAGAGGGGGGGGRSERDGVWAGCGGGGAACGALGVFHRPGPVFWFRALLDDEEEAEKLRCSWLDVEDSSEEDTCGCGAQWSGPPTPGDTHKLGIPDDELRAAQQGPQSAAVTDSSARWRETAV